MNIVRIEFLKFSRNILDDIWYLRNNKQIQKVYFQFAAAISDVKYILYYIIKLDGIGYVKVS